MKPLEVRAEVAAPLGDAVRLVDRQDGHAAVLQVKRADAREAAVRRRELRRQVDDLQNFLRLVSGPCIGIFPLGKRWTR